MMSGGSQTTPYAADPGAPCRASPVPRTNCPRGESVTELLTLEGQGLEAQACLCELDVVALVEYQVGGPDEHVAEAAL